MSFLLVHHLSRLVAIVAKFSMCEGKGSNLIDYFLVLLVLVTTTVDNARPFANGMTYNPCQYFIFKKSVLIYFLLFSSYFYLLNFSIFFYFH